MGKQVNQYDKILKENIEAVIPGLMQDVLGITAVLFVDNTYRLSKANDSRGTGGNFGLWSCQ